MADLLQALQEACKAIRKPDPGRRGPKAKPARGAGAARIRDALQGIAHRDMKPANFVAASPELTPEVRVNLTTHAVYVHLREGAVARSEPCLPSAPSVRAHLDDEGRLLGVQVLSPRELSWVGCVLDRFEPGQPLGRFDGVYRALRHVPALLTS